MSWLLARKTVNSSRLAPPPRPLALNNPAPPVLLRPNCRAGPAPPGEAFCGSGNGNDSTGGRCRTGLAVTTLRPPPSLALGSKSGSRPSSEPSSGDSNSCTVTLPPNVCFGARFSPTACWKKADDTGALTVRWKGEKERPLAANGLDPGLRPWLVKRDGSGEGGARREERRPAPGPGPGERPSATTREWEWEGEEGGRET